MAEWAAVLVAIILGIVNLLWSRSLAHTQNALNKEQLKISEGQIELEMAEQLSNAKKYVDSYEALCFNYMNDEEKKKAVNAKKEFVMEEYLNCLENLCQKYLDKKVDMERFQKSYCNEVRNLFGPNSIYKAKLDGDSSPFKAIKKVYNRWENRE
jgi:lysyl-tRNA synthetase class I